MNGAEQKKSERTKKKLFEIIIVIAISLWIKTVIKLWQSWNKEETEKQR